MARSTFRIWYYTVILSASLYCLLFLRYRHGQDSKSGKNLRKVSLSLTGFKNESKRSQHIFPENKLDICETIEHAKILKGKKKFKILWYNPIHGGLYPEAEKVDLSTCSYNNCFMEHFDVSRKGYIPGKTVLDADAILFDGSKLATTQPPKRRNKDQVFVFVDIEPPAMHHTEIYKTAPWNNVFNWTMTYRTDSDILYSYGKLTKKLPESEVKNYETMFRRKSKDALWLVSSCQSKSDRNLYAKKLGKYIKIDTLGACSPKRKMICKHGGMDECLYDFVKNTYKFYLSLENSFCSNYLSEKVYRWYDKDVIPVVRGTSTKGELLPQGTYIDTDNFPTIEDLGRFLQRVGRNQTLFLSYLREKDKYHLQKRLTMAQTGYCEICKRLNHVDCFRKSYASIKDWWFKDACRKPTDLV